MTDPTALILAEIDALTTQRDTKLAELQTIDGAIQAFRYLLTMLAEEASDVH